MKDYEKLQRENTYLKQLLMKMMHNDTQAESSKIVIKYSFTLEKNDIEKL